MFWVYIVECSDGSLYTGWTVNLEKRIAEHNRGEGAKYTRSRYPVILRYSEKHAARREAMQRECCLKRLTRKEKLELINLYNT